MGKHEIGLKGEEIAKNYLQSNSYEVLEERWRYNKAELDIICKKGDALIFVEVKTRSTDYYGPPEEFVSVKKKKLMSMAASAYMQKVNHDWEIRFDIISIIIDGKQKHKLQHFKDAFFLGL